jgi:hypothetical protein
MSDIYQLRPVKGGVKGDQRGLPNAFADDGNEESTGS